MVEPDFRRVDPMPVAAFVCGEQEVDAGSGGAARIRGLPCLAVVAAFGVRCEPEPGDDLLRGHGLSVVWQQDREKGVKMRIIVIGAGVIGATLAFQLARRGVDVTVLDAAAAPAAGATGASFGWINASYFLNEDHFRLRVAGMEAWRALAQEVDLAGALNWCGALCWDVQGAALAEACARFAELGYPATQLSGAEVAAMEPALAHPPQEALFHPQDGVAEPVAVCDRVLRAATGAGARVMFGVQATEVVPGRVVTGQGVFEADRIVVAAGTGAAALLQQAGVAVAMLPRPALVLRTVPMAPVVSRVLVTPDGEVRQDAEGRIVMPTAVGHQSASDTDIADRPDKIADAAAERLRELLNVGDRLEWADVTVAHRPMPSDELPVVGECGGGLYAAVMHSGITLAAIVAELAAADLLDLPDLRLELLAPFRPDRFA